MYKKIRTQSIEMSTFPILQTFESILPLLNRKINQPYGLLLLC